MQKCKISFWCRLIVAGLIGVQSVPLAAQKSEDVTDLTRDTRLATTVTIQSVRQELKGLLTTLSKTNEIQLTVAPDIASRRITLIANHVSLRHLMTNLAFVTGFEWRKPMPGSGQDADYQLYRSEGARLREQRLIRDSEEREEKANNAIKNALRDAIRKAVADRKADTHSLADLLADLTPEQQKQIEDAVTQPEGVISASDQSHFHNRLLFATPFTQLPVEQQNSVAGMLGRPEYAKDESGNAKFAPAVSEISDLARSHVGLIATRSGVRLGIVGPDGKDVWVSPTDSVRRKSVPGVDMDDDTPPEVGDELVRGRLVLLEGVPNAIKNKKLRFPRELDRTFLHVLLAFLAEQTGLSMLSDDFLRSGQTPYSWLLTDKEEYTLAEALEQIARAYSRRFTYRSGMLCARTLVPGLDLRAEPPAELIARLRELSAKQEPPDLSDYIAFGKLSRLQLDMLSLRLLSGVTRGMPLLRAIQLHNVLRLYARLTPEQRKQAETAKGVPTDRFNAPQREAFRMVSDIGLPARTANASLPDKSGFYVQRESRGKTETVTFLIVSDSRPARKTAYSLTVPVKLAMK